MTGKDVEQADEQSPGLKPWLAGLGSRGAAGLIVLGGVAALWVFFGRTTGTDWLPFVPDEPSIAYYQAAKVAAVGAVILASLLLHRRRTRTAATEEAVERQRD